MTTFIMEQDPRRHNNRHATFGAITLRLSVLMSLVKKINKRLVSSEFPVNQTRIEILTRPPREHQRKHLVTVPVLFKGGPCDVFDVRVQF